MNINIIKKMYFGFLILIGSFFILQPSITAQTKGDIYNYINLINNQIEDIETKLTNSKRQEQYIKDASFKESIDYFEKSLLIQKNVLFENQKTINNGIKLSTLVKKDFSDKETEFNLYYPNDYLINSNDVINITYLQNNNEIIFLTANEINESIINNYLKDIYNIVVNYNNNFDSIINSYQDSYNDLLNNLTNTKIYILTETQNIKDFEDNEKKLNNNPNMIVNTENIYLLLEKEVNLLDNIYISIDEINALNSKINAIKQSSQLIIDSFYNNNQNYIDNNLKTQIDDFSKQYADLDSNFKNWFSSNQLDINDFYSSTTKNYSLKINEDLINYFLKIYELENNYNSLLDNINNYLLRRPSDTDIINRLLESINQQRIYLNNNKILSNIDNLVSVVDLTNEDKVDLLYKFLSLPNLSEETIKKIKNAKLSFYPITLKNNNNYQFDINNNYLVIKNLMGGLNKKDLYDNIFYSEKYEIISEINYINNSSVLNLYDKKGVLIATYNIFIQGDINNDGIVNNDDVILFKNKILNNNFCSSDVIIVDFNNDNILDIKDLDIFNNQINKHQNNYSSSIINLIINTEINNNKIYFSIKVKTNGGIRALEFDIGNSKNLLLCGISNLNSKVTIVGNKVIGLNEFIDNENIITMCYENNNNDNYEFNIKNIKLIDMSGNYYYINNISNISNKKNISNSNNKQALVLLSNTVSKSNANSTQTIEEIQPIQSLENNKKIVQQEEKLLLINVIKIIIVVLLGTLIIYYINKNETEDNLVSSQIKTTDKK